MSSKWNPPYHRDQMPDGIDNSNFGSICETKSLIEHDFSLGPTVNSGKSGPYTFGASKVYSRRKDAGAGVYRICTANFQMAVCDPVQTTLFLPDHAALVGAADSPVLISESLWHSELPYSKFFRCDRTTDWKYRVENSYETRDVSGLFANVYHRYYYQYFHWLMDSVPRIWLIQKRLKNKTASWFSGTLNMAFHAPSLSLFDLEAENFVQFEDECVVRFDSAYNAAFRFEENINTLRPDFNSGTYYVGWNYEYIDELRGRGRRKVASIGSIDKIELIYITRPDATHRKIRNHKEVLDLLEAYGFTEFTPGTKSFYEQISVFKDAKFVVGVHGAGLTNILWANSGATVVEFMPEGLNDVGYRFLANFSDHTHSVLECEASEHPLGIAYADIHVDLTILEELLKDIM